MAQRSLFRTLIESPWWVSLLAAVPTYAVGALLSRLFPGDANPHVLGVAAALPFLGVGVYTGWLRIRRGPSLDAPSLLKALRSASPDDMRAMLAEAYDRARYEIADGASGDLELQRNGYLTLVRFRRWRAQSTGPAAVDELRSAMRARKADHGVYITAGTVTESARKRAGETDVTFVDGFALADLLG
ncbi:MAG: restriction endonuclease, partial [Burkholderiales bacterium]